MMNAVDDTRLQDSVIVHFDAGDLLDALSLGVVILDSQLCAIYANVGAEALLSVPAAGLRGRPLASFLPQPQPFLRAVERALESGESVVFDLAGCAPWSARAVGIISSRVAPVREQLSGRHLLLELCEGPVVPETWEPG